MKAARIAKWRETETQEQTSSPKAQNRAHPQTDKVTFVWDGSRLLQEIHPDRTHTYIYTEADSYEPLAQITNYTDPDKAQQIHYFHCDQIGIPRAMTDEEGNIVWRGQYSGWGKLLHEEKANNHIHQPFRLQNQYADEETGLYYNFFRYYDAHCGRFTQQDPIGLMGGDNLYSFAPNTMGWIDSLGLYNAQKCASIAARIQNLKDEIYKKRIPALQSNPQNLPWRIGPGEALRDTVRGHVKLLNAAYSKLAKAEKEWVDNGCDKPPPPSAPAIVNVIYFSYKAAMPQTVWVIRQGEPTPYEK